MGDDIGVVLEGLWVQLASQNGVLALGLGIGAGMVQFCGWGVGASSERWYNNVEDERL
jgi:hypothetical protein